MSCVLRRSRAIVKVIFSESIVRHFRIFKRLWPIVYDAILMVYGFLERH